MLSLWPALAPVGRAAQAVSFGRESAQVNGRAPRALVLEPFAADLGEGDVAGQPQVSALKRAGFSVDVYVNGAVTIPLLEGMAAYSVIYIESHSGVLPHGDAFVLDGERNPDPYRNLFLDGSVVQGGPETDPGDLYVGVTHSFIQKHTGTFPDSSLVFLNGCSILTAPTFWQTLLEKNVGAIVSWTGQTDSKVAESAAAYVFGRMASGASVASAVSETRGAGLGESSTVYGDAQLDFRGDGNDTLASAAVEATPRPTAAPTPTPPKRSCGHAHRTGCGKTCLNRRGRCSCNARNGCARPLSGGGSHPGAALR